MPARFTIRKTSNGQFHFNLSAGNNRIVLSSERYSSKSRALKGIQSVRVNCGADRHYERRTSAKGQPYFVLRAANKEIIGRSEMYSSRSAMERGIASVRRNGRRAVVRDLT